MKKTMAVAAALGLSSLASSQIINENWGGVTGDAALLAFANAVGNSDSGYAYQGQNTRSAAELAVGFPAPLLVTSRMTAGKLTNINAMYAGGSTVQTHQFGFDIYELNLLTPETGFGDLVGTVFVDPDITGVPDPDTSGPLLPAVPNANLGITFSKTLNSIIADLEAVSGNDHSGVNDFVVDFFIIPTDLGGSVGTLGDKLKVSDFKSGDGRESSVFDYSQFVNDTDGVADADAGDFPIEPIPGGFPDGLEVLLGWEDQFIDGNPQVPDDQDYNDFFITYGDSDTPINQVPEPSTYGLIGAAALLALIARRRLAAKRG